MTEGKESDMAGPGAVNLTKRISQDVLLNPIILESIVKYLSDAQIESMCLAFPGLKEKMDSSLWRKRTRKLQSVLRMDDTDKTSYQEKYMALKQEVERIIDIVSEYIIKNQGAITLNAPELEFDEENQEEFMSIENLAYTASLIHHKMLGEVEIKLLCFWCVDVLKNTDPQHLASLASRVKEVFVFYKEKKENFNIAFIIQSLKCSEVEVMIDPKSEGSTLRTEEKLALSLAMETRIPKITFYYGTEDPTDVIKQYSGKGVCYAIQVLTFSASDSREVEDIRLLAQQLEWNIEEKENFGPMIELEINMSRGQQQQM